MKKIQALDRPRRWLCFASLGICFLGACASKTSPVPDLVCQTLAKEAGDCSGVPSIHQAELELSRKLTFQLQGRYEACYRAEDVEISGTYRAFPHANGVDIELLAKRSAGGDSEAEALQRTIGLVNLDTETLEGRFTDTGVLIRSRGQVKEAPSLLMQCTEK